MIKIFACLAFLLLTACGHPKEFMADVKHSAATSSPVFSRSLFKPGEAESTPLTYQGTPMVVVFNRGPNKVVEFRGLNGSLLHSKPWTRDFGCAYAEGSRMYLFGTNEARSVLSMTYSDDLVHWSPTRNIKEAKANQTIWNCSVIANDRGSYTMVYEVQEPGINGFSFRFMRSRNLVNWLRKGALYSTDYSACPTIKSVDGVFYIFFLSQEGGGFKTRVTKTKDFTHFVQSGTVVIEAGPGEGFNASDFDLMEYEGKVYAVYLNGDQHGAGNLMLAVYNGNLRQFVYSLYP